MRAWVFIWTATFLYAQALGSADFGDKVNSPVTTESPRLSPDSSKDSSKERSSLESRHAADIHQGRSSGSSDIAKRTRKPTKDVSKSERIPYQSTPSPQEPFRQHLESPYNVNSLDSVGNNENPIAALYEATRAAYVQSNLYPLSATPYFQNPNVPFDGVNSRQPLINTNPVAHPQHVTPQPAFHQHTGNRFTQPLQHNRIQETSFVGISNNNFDDYDDGSYDPYKYGDYLYFDNDEDTYNHDHQKQNSPSTVAPTTYQQTQSLPSTPSSQVISNNNYQPNYDHYNQNNKNAHKPLTNALPQQTPQYQSYDSNHINQHNNHYQQNFAQLNPQSVHTPSKNFFPQFHQQSQSFNNNPMNHHNNNYQQNFAQLNPQNAHTPSTNFHPQLHQQPQYFNSNPINQYNNNYQQSFPQQTPQNAYQPQHLHSPVQPKNTPSYSKDAKKFIDDSYNYQVEAAKQYLKEIEEAQDYAKKVLASSNPHQPSQPFSDQADYYNQNQHSPTHNNEGRYNNFPSESSQYKQTADPSQEVVQPLEVNSIMANDNHAIISQDHGREYFDHSQISSSHQEPPRQLSSSQHESPSYTSSVPLTGPTAAPVVLPSGFLADTEKVRLAKIAHLQLVLDTLKTVSTYRSQYPKRRPINAL